MDVFQVNRVAKTKPLKGQCSKTHKRKPHKPNAIFMNFKSKSNKKKSNK